MQKSPVFAGLGPNLFGAPRTEGEHDEGKESRDDDGPHFEPIIALPEKIKVSTGEEDEEVLFSHRAKLYRFNKEMKQWKERGVGEIKLLCHKKTGKVRVLMRRDQVLKVCANHQVTVSMKLQANVSSDKSWVWHTAADFADEEPKPEQLAVKFKTSEVAKQFKAKFDECHEILKLAESQKGEEQVSGASVQPSASEDIFKKFKPRAGSWECETCLVGNSSDKTACVACGALKPGEGSGESTSKGDADIFDKFKPKAGSWECGTCLVSNSGDETACVACGALKPGQEPGKSETATNDTSKPEFHFGTQAAQRSAPVFGFGVQPKESLGADGSEKPKFLFGTSPITTSAGSGFVFAGTSREGDSKPDASSGFVFGGKLNEQDSKPADSSSECGFVFGGQPKENASQTKDSSGLGFSTDRGAAPSSGFVFGGKLSEQDSKPADSSSECGFVFGVQPKESVSQTKDSTGLGFSLDKDAAPSTSAGFVVANVNPLDKFKPKAGSWECDTCLVSNNGGKTACVACGTAKPGQEPGKSATDTTKPQLQFGLVQAAPSSTPLFGFGVQPKGSENQTKDSSGLGFSLDKAAAPSTSAGFVDANVDPLDKFKPKPGSWECDTCLVSNSGDNTACVACGTAISEAVKTSSENPPNQHVATEGDASKRVLQRFKPKPGSWECNTRAGSWECETCLVGNSSDKTACVACGALKPGEGSGESTSKGDADIFDKFKPKAGSWECGTCLVSNSGDETACAACGTLKPGQEPGKSETATKDTSKPQFHFGTQAAQSSAPVFGFGVQPKGSLGADGSEKPKFLFGTSSSTTSAGSGFVFAGKPREGASNPGRSSGFVFGGKLSEQDAKPVDSSSECGFVFGVQPKESGSQTKDSSGLGFLLDKAAAPSTSAGFVDANVDPLDKFKPKPGSWECDTCLVSNSGDKTACVACGTAISEAVKTSSEKPPNQHVAPEGDASKGLLERFKPKAGSWECDTCLVNNSGDKTACAACGTAKPGQAPGKSATATTKPQVQFGTKSKPGQEADKSEAVKTSSEKPPNQHVAPEGDASKGLLERFKPKAGSWECDTCLVNNSGDKTACVACGTAKPGQEPGKSLTDVAKPPFQFGAPHAAPSTTPLFGFGVQPKESGDKSESEKPKFFFGAFSTTPSKGSTDGGSLPSTSTSFVFTSNSN